MKSSFVDKMVNDSLCADAQVRELVRQKSLDSPYIQQKILSDLSVITKIDTSELIALFIKDLVSSDPDLTHWLDGHVDDKNKALLDLFLNEISGT
jgi:hypothetical protein